jgi:hypothetical protein
MTPEETIAMLQQGLQALVAALDPRDATFGHGSYGKECPVCRGSNYSGPLVEHRPDCALEAARAALAAVRPGAAA